MSGIIDGHGSFVVEPKYVAYAHFSEGLAAVTIDGHQWGFVDSAGNTAIPPDIHITSDYVLSAYQMNFQGGLAPVPLPIGHQ